jgi:hypothetical protein
MQSREFPDCCAGVIFNGFGHTRTAMSGSTPYTEKYVNDWLEHNERIWGSRGFAQIVLNQDQRKMFHTLLKGRGYRCLIASIYHPGHKSRISIYLKEFNKQ